MGFVLMYRNPGKVGTICRLLCGEVCLVKPTDMIFYVSMS